MTALWPMGAAQATSLVDALRLAYQTNPQLQAARAQLRRTDEGVPQALSGWRPHVSIVAQAGSAVRNNSIDPRMMPERLTPQDYELNLTQNLYTSGQVTAQVKQAREQVEMGRATLEAVEDDVLLAAATSYADVVRDRAIVALEQRQVDVLSRTLRASSVEAASGAITEADRDQALARLANQRAAAATAVAIEQASEARYEQEIGVPPDTVALPAVALPVAASQADAVSQALADNPSLVAARDAVAVSRLGVDIQIDQLLPQIALHGVIERLREYEYESHAQRADEAQVTVELTMPIYQGGLLYSKIRAAKEDNVRFQDLEEEERRQARASVLSAWAALTAARIRVAESRTAVQADKVAGTGIGQQQSVGARTVIDELIAEQDTLASEVAAVSADHDVLTASLTLLAVTGRLDPADLAPGVARYDPRAHFLAVREKWAGTSPPGDEAVRPAGAIRLPVADAP